SSSRRHTRFSRDWVQTCALPISSLREAASGATQPPWLAPTKPAAENPAGCRRRASVSAATASPARAWKSWVYSPAEPPVPRLSSSEERRVGEECKAPGSPGEDKH